MMLKIVPDPPHALYGLLRPTIYDWLGSDVAHQRPADSLQR